MNEFEKQIHAMFDHIWDCEIEHPVFQDTVGDLMNAVIQCYEQLHSSQPEIIQCRECENWIPGYITDQDDFIPPKCGKYQQMVGHSADDFCSLAERNRMSDVCGDNRFEIIEAYKKKLIDDTNIESRPDEMAVIDNILFRFWQMGWLPSAKPETEERTAKSAQNVQNDELISKKVAIDAINKNRDSVFHDSVHYEDAVYDISNLPSAQPESTMGQATDVVQSTKDCIGRQAAIDAVNRALDRETLLNKFVRKVAVDAIRALPSAQPEHKTGKWIYTPTEPLGYICSECQKGCCRYNFCPNCGARMEDK